MSTSYFHGNKNSCHSEFDSEQNTCVECSTKVMKFKNENSLYIFAHNVQFQNHMITYSRGISSKFASTHCQLTEYRKIELILSSNLFFDTRSGRKGGRGVTQVLRSMPAFWGKMRSASSKDGIVTNKDPLLAF